MNIPKHKETSEGILAVVKTPTILPNDSKPTKLTSNEVWIIDDSKE